MKSIVVTSGKGGVGKTTVTACLGKALAALGFRVVLLDADFGLNNLDVVLGLENRVVYDIADVIDNRCRVRQALVEAVRNGLYLLPSAHGYLGEKVTAQNLKLILKSLAVTFDYALVDCPAGIETGFKRAVTACERAIVVTTPHISAIRDASKVVTLLGSYRINADGGRQPRARRSFGGRAHTDCGRDIGYTQSGGRWSDTGDRRGVRR